LEEKTTGTAVAASIFLNFNNLVVMQPWQAAKTHAEVRLRLWWVQILPPDLGITDR